MIIEKLEHNQNNAVSNATILLVIIRNVFVICILT